MATSQEWIIDQKKEFFFESQDKEKKSRRIFSESDPIQRFDFDHIRSKIGRNWFDFIKTYYFIENKLWWIGYFARMSEVGSNDRNMTHNYRQFCKMLPISQSLHVTLHHHVTDDWWNDIFGHMPIFISLIINGFELKCNIIAKYKSHWIMESWKPQNTVSKWFKM